jgi:lipoprotein-anchoring transpeptidase ErfK/SrfK
LQKRPVALSLPPFMEKRNLSSLIFAVTVIGMLAGCATKPPPPPPKPTPDKPAPPYTWNDTGAKGDPRIVVNVSRQRAYFYRGNSCVGDTRCSTGKKGFATQVGNYAVTQKDKNHVSNLYGSFVNEAGEVTRRDVDMSKMQVPEGSAFQGAKMPFYMRFTGGYGLHAGYVPNYPASHGCVRLPRVMAEHFFQNCQVGTPVIVEE